MREPLDARQANLQRDIVLAEYLCRETQNDHPEALEILYTEYHRLFQRYIAKKVGDIGLRDEILQEFWCKLLDGTDICGYQAQKGISLRSYLIRRLHYRILDALRTSTRYRMRFVGQEIVGDPSEGDGANRPMDTLQNFPFEVSDSSDIDVTILYEALDVLSEVRPDDALLIRHYLSGKTYDEIAAMCCSGSEEDIRRKSTALRKQFSRARQRLGIIIERLSENPG